VAKENLFNYLSFAEDRDFHATDERVDKRGRHLIHPSGTQDCGALLLLLVLGSALLVAGHRKALAGGS